eukprot:gene26227-biopygen15058
MNSCHGEGVRNPNRAGIEAADDPARDRHRFQLDSRRAHPPRDRRNWAFSEHQALATVPAVCLRGPPRPEILIGDCR